MAAAVFGLLKLVAPSFGCAFEELCSGASPVVAGPDRPEAVSAGPPATAPASGHPTSAEPPAAVDDPGFTAPLSPGSPRFVGSLVVEDRLVQIGKEHGELHVTPSGTWECGCGTALPNGENVLTAHLRHVSRVQADALWGLFGEAIQRGLVQLPTNEVVRSPLRTVPDQPTTPMRGTAR